MRLIAHVQAGTSVLGTANNPSAVIFGSGWFDNLIDATV